MIEWFDLKTNPPSKDEGSILVFPFITDVGHLYTVSNSAYVVKHIGAHSYTHWARINPPTPGLLADAMMTVARWEVHENRRFAYNHAKTK